MHEQQTEQQFGQQDPGLGCQVCRRRCSADGDHVLPPPWPHRAHPAWCTIGWTTRGLAVFATIPAPDPNTRDFQNDYVAGTVEKDGPDDETDGGYDLVLGRWWDIARRPAPPQD